MNVENNTFGLATLCRPPVRPQLDWLSELLNSQIDHIGLRVVDTPREVGVWLVQLCDII
jgi:hypothetical protein